MDKCSVETLIKETLIYYCRNYVGEAVEFKLDGLICITVNSEPVDTVFKIHEIISGNDSISNNQTNYHSNRRKSKRKLNNKQEVNTEGEENSTDFDKENKTGPLPEENIDKKIKIEFDDNYSDEEMQFETDKCSSSFACGVCLNFRDVTKQFLVNHLLEDHNGENDMMCFCMTNNCQLGFLNEDQYLEHFQTSHKSSAIDVMLREKDLMRSLSAEDEQPSRGINAIPIFPISSKTLSKNQTSNENVPNNSTSKLSSSVPVPDSEEAREADLEQENNASSLSDGNEDFCRPKQCQMCRLEFLDFTSCDDHTSSAHGIYMCPYCDIVFKWKSSRDSHVLAHSSEGKLLECNKCLLVFSRLDSLKKHIAKCQGGPTNQKDSSNLLEYSGNSLAEDNSSIDPTLASLFSNPEDLAIAQGIANSRGLDWASGFDQGNYHLKNDAIEINSDQEEGMPDEMNISLETTPFKRSGRRRHTKYITTLDPNRCFTCEVCLEFVSGGVEAFKIHCSQLHQRVPCPYCGCTYTQKASMERHQRQHTGERPYICALCPRSYTRKENLHMHRLRFHPIAEDIVNVP